MAIVAAVLVVAAAVVVPIVLLDDDGDPTVTDAEAADDADDADDADEADDPTDPEDPVESSLDPDDATLDDVQTFLRLEPDHVPLGDPVTYRSSPPAGGNHWSEWLDCGVYDVPVADENAVHDLEHGAIWITYDPSLDEADVDALADQLPQNGIMSPYPDLPAPVVITVWSKQLYLTGADDPRIALFVDEYDDGVTAPEPFASCAGGTAQVAPSA